MKSWPNMDGWTNFRDILKDTGPDPNYVPQTAEWMALDSLNDDLADAESYILRAATAIFELLENEHAWDNTLMPLTLVTDALQARAKALNAKYRDNEETLKLTRKKKEKI